MSTRLIFTISFIICLFFAGCAPQTDFDIRGEWEYSMTTLDGNTYDISTITFSGEAAQGIYHEINIYQVDYEGEYIVNGADLKLTGDETWEGIINDVSTINGNWSHDDSVGGTFNAARK